MTGASLLTWRVEDATGALLHRLAVRNTIGSWPQYLGSGVDDDIRVSSPMVPARAVRLVPSGRHMLVTALVAGSVIVDGVLLAEGAERRADRSFEVAGIKVVFDDGDED